LNTTDLAENEFGLLAAIVSLLREFGAARSIVYNRWSFGLVATPAEIEPRGVLIVTRLDRLARSTRDLWADTTTPHGRLMLTVLGGLAEFERELIRARTGEGRGKPDATRRARWPIGRTHLALH
jgi:hypothetical protein